MIHNRVPHHGQSTGRPSLSGREVAVPRFADVQVVIEPGDVQDVSVRLLKDTSVQVEVASEIEIGKQLRRRLLAKRRRLDDALTGNLKFGVLGSRQSQRRSEV